MSTALPASSRRLDFIRFLGLGHSEIYKEWYARLEVKDSGTAILQKIDAKPGRKPRLMDPKSRSYSFQVTKLSRAENERDTFLLLTMNDGKIQRIGLGQVMLRDAANPEWRYYDAPESEARFDHKNFA